MTVSRVKFSINGGRDGGYRNYTIQHKVWDGEIIRHNKISEQECLRLASIYTHQEIASIERRYSVDGHRRAILHSSRRRSPCDVGSNTR